MKCWFPQQLLVSVKVYQQSRKTKPWIFSASEYGSDKPRSVITREGDNLRLRCPANGFPKPSVEWIREDEKTISYGAWEMSSLSGDTLNITKINRLHMGLWKCLADNGLGVANQTFQIDVYCEFYVKIFWEAILHFPS